MLLAQARRLACAYDIIKCPTPSVAVAAFGGAWGVEIAASAPRQRPPKARSLLARAWCRNTFMHPSCACIARSPTAERLASTMS